MKTYFGPEFTTDTTFMRSYISRRGHGLKIPKKVMKRVKEGNQNRNYVTLSCAVTPGMLWAADIVGRKLMSGWETFAEENFFIDGDLLLFKYNGSTKFHVENFRANSGNTANSGNAGRSSQNSANNHLAAAIGNEEMCIIVTITADKIKKSRMYLLHDFCTANDLHKFSGKDISMLAEDGTSFAVKLKTEVFDSRERLRLGNGLREFF